MAKKRISLRAGPMLHTYIEKKAQQLSKEVGEHIPKSEVVRKILNAHLYLEMSPTFSMNSALMEAKGIEEGLKRGELQFGRHGVRRKIKRGKVTINMTSLEGMKKNYKSGVSEAGRENDYCEGLRQIKGIDRCVKEDEWEEGVKGKQDKFIRRFEKAIEGA